MSTSHSAEQVLDVPLPEAIGLRSGTRRERRDGPAPDSLLERAELDYSCGKIARRCTWLRRRSEGKRILRDVLDVIPGPVELRCKGAKDATARLERLKKGEWSIYFGREEGFDLGFFGAGREARRDPFVRITHLQAGLIEGDTHSSIDGHMVMIPEPGKEAVFRGYFGIPDGEEYPAHRFQFADDPVFAAEAVREALGNVRRPR